MWELKARLDHLSDGVATFDPIQVVSRMREAFPNLETDARDGLLNTCKAFGKQSGSGAEGALKTAVKDIYERGPAIKFRIPIDSGEAISGVAERYWVRVLSLEKPFPDDFKETFLGFLNSLKFQPIEVTSSAPDS